MNVPSTIERRRLLPVPLQRSAASLALAGRQPVLWRTLIVVLDVLTFSAFFGGVMVVRAQGTGVHLDWNSHVLMFGWLPLATIVVTLCIVGGYDHRTDMMGLTYMSEHLIGMGAALIGALIVIYCFASYEMPVKPGRGTLLLAFVAFTPVSLVYRRAIGARLQADMARKHFLVVGTAETAAAFFAAYKSSNNRQALRFLDLAVPGAGGEAVDRADREADVAAEVHALTDLVEGIVVTLPLADMSEALRDALVRVHFQRTAVFTLDTFYETYWRRIPVYALNPAWPLQLGFQLARSSPYQHCKRLFDIVGAAIGLIVLAPLFGLIALLTLWDSGRPVVFRQERVGRGGKRFTILKFRSMRNRKADEVDDRYTRTNDVRVTRCGRWLRKLRLDELPQLYNVLRGDMSLIGPRAEWVRCAEQYERNIPSYHFRHLVKPGITGWAQVNYAYGENEDDAVQKLKYDLYYIRRYSLRLDAMIVLKTLHIILWGKGQ